MCTRQAVLIVDFLHKKVGFTGFGFYKEKWVYKLD